jgi:hypothetical protein
MMRPVINKAKFLGEARYALAPDRLEGEFALSAWLMCLAMGG